MPETQEEEPVAEENPQFEEETTEEIEERIDEEIEELPEESYEEALEKLIDEGANQEVLLEFTFDWMARQPISTTRVQPLFPIVEGISQTGELKIRFNNRMLVPPGDDYTDIDVKSIISLKVVSSFHSYGSELIAIEDYRLISYANDTVVIQVDFLNPNNISMDPVDKDFLLIEVKELRYFQDIMGQ